MKTTLRLLAVTAVIALQACSGGSGGGGSERDPAAVGGGDQQQGFVYSGPAPADSEIQAFKLSFYDNLVLEERCGSCHTRGGGGTTAFVDRDDVNYAWRQARGVVNLTDPAASAVVTRVANGHNCWLSSNATCATLVQGYVEQWAAGAQSSTATVQLYPRNIYMPSGTRTFPADSLAFAGSDLYNNYLKVYCADCHSDTAAVAQSPFFASADADVAYQAAQSKIDLNNPANSRLVVRLRYEFHQCWDGDCQQASNEMEQAIADYAGTLPAPAQVDPNLVISAAQIIEDDGIIASSGGRYETDVVAKWEFREGVGNTVADTSGVQPEINLSLTGTGVEWLGGWGARFTGGRAQGASADSLKLRDKITATNEYSVEAWVAPANVTQEDAWIFAYSGGPMDSNTVLAQTMYNYDAYTRSTAMGIDAAGAPALSTPDADELAQATLQHVVMTYDPVAGRRLYVNGVDSGVVDPQGGGLLDWDASFAVTVGNNPANTDPWEGVARMVAVHNRALSPSQILQNFDVGVGQKYYLLFSVSDLLPSQPDCIEDGTHYCYVVFTVSQFDAYSYQFADPFFVSLNPDFQPGSFRIRGIRIGVNGKLMETGQAFVNVDATVNSSNYREGGQPLADIGTIIALENGASADMFFLAFDEIDGMFTSVPAPTPAAFSYTLSGGDSSDIAVRNFEEINATFANVTDVPNTEGTAVYTLFHNIKRQLPTVESFQAYLASHHMGVTQLAIAYCDALVEGQGNTTPAAYFNGFDFSDAVTTADGVSDADWENNVIVPLVDRALSTGLADQPNRHTGEPVPNRSDVIAELLLLINDTRNRKPYYYDPSAPSADSDGYVSQENPGDIPVESRDSDPDGLARCNGSCPAGRKKDVAKAVCGAVLGSAAVLLQ